MSIVRTALPLVLLTSVLTGCAGLQKTDWPTCAAVGGVVGAAFFYGAVALEREEYLAKLDREEDLDT